MVRGGSCTSSCLTGLVNLPYGRLALLGEWEGVTTYPDVVSFGRTGPVQGLLPQGLFVPLIHHDLLGTAMTPLRAPSPPQSSLRGLLIRYVTGQISETQWARVTEILDARGISATEREACACLVDEIIRGQPS